MNWIIDQESIIQYRRASEGGTSLHRDVVIEIPQPFPNLSLAHALSLARTHMSELGQVFIAMPKSRSMFFPALDFSMKAQPLPPGAISVYAHGIIPAWGGGGDLREAQVRLRG